MSVSLFIGKTQSGKSHLAEKLSKQRKKVVIYDNARCFNDGIIVDDFSPENFKKIFLKYINAESFRLIFRAPLKMNEKEGAERVAHLFYSGFGHYWKERNYKGENILFLVDEADKVSSEKKNSPFYLMVTKGRHFFIDTWAMSQGPGKIPLYYRENANELFIFKSIPHQFFKENLEKEQIDEIRFLGKWHFLHWLDSGHAEIKNEKGKTLKKWS